jgi:hypothetical protein
MNRFSVFCLAVLVALTLLHIGYRYSYVKKIPADVYHGSQAERLEKWNSLKRLSLTDSNIDLIVGDMLRSQTLPRPGETEEFSWEALTVTQKEDLVFAITGFFKAYRSNDPEPAFEYLAIQRGQTEFSSEMRKVLLPNPKSVQTDEEIFSGIWNVGPRGIGWQSILSKSGQSCLWTTNLPLTMEQLPHKVLEEPDLFQNVTSMGHIFAVNDKMKSLLEQKRTLLFIDIFFVAELIPDKDSDFCATGVRFWFNEDNQKWVPSVLVFTTPRPRQDLAVPF